MSLEEGDSSRFGWCFCGESTMGKNPEMKMWRAFFFSSHQGLEQGQK